MQEAERVRHQNEQAEREFQEVLRRAKLDEKDEQKQRLKLKMNIKSEIQNQIQMDYNVQVNQRLQQLADEKAIVQRDQSLKKQQEKSLRLRKRQS